jgi:hypothetical protein
MPLGSHARGVVALLVGFAVHAGCTEPPNPRRDASPEVGDVVSVDGDAADVGDADGEGGLDREPPRDTDPVDVAVGHPITLEQFPVALRGADCDRIFRCDREPGEPDLRTFYGSAEACREILARNPDKWLADLQRLVAAGTVRYDPIAAGRCVARAATSCVFWRERAGVCAEVFTGTVATGGPCWRHEECAGDGYCVQMSATVSPRCPGQCRPRVPLGAACTGIGDSCSRRGAVGHVWCGAASPLATSVCYDLRDGAPTPEGAPCGEIRANDALYFEARCAAGLYCPSSPADPSTRTCLRLPTRGMPCNLRVRCWESECVVGADRRTATCGDSLVRSRVGERCSPPGTLPSAGSCNPVARLTCNSGGVCESLGDGREGSRCSTDSGGSFTCNAGLYCDRTALRCLRKKPNGEPCVYLTECQEECVGGTCGRICEA